MIPRLKERYNKDVVTTMMKTFEYKNVMQVPKLEKVVINMGIGDAKDNPKPVSYTHLTLPTNREV